MNVSRVDNVYAAGKQMSTEDLVLGGMSLRTAMLGGTMGLRTATGIKSQSPRRHSGQN